MKSKLLRILQMSAGLILLTSCAMVQHSKPPAKTFNYCKQIKLPHYDQSFKDKLANEIEAAPTNAEWPTMIQDYNRMYKGVEACHDLP